MKMGKIYILPSTKNEAKLKERSEEERMEESEKEKIAFFFEKIGLKLFCNRTMLFLMIGLDSAVFSLVLVIFGLSSSMSVWYVVTFSWIR